MQRPLGQDPGHPGVDGAEGQLAPLGPRPVGIGQVEDGGQLGGRGVGGHADALALQLEAGADGPQVLPAEARARPGRPSPGPTPGWRPAGWRSRRPRRVRRPPDCGRPPRRRPRRWPCRRTRPARGTGCRAGPGRGGCARRWHRDAQWPRGPPRCRRRRPGCSRPGHLAEGGGQAELAGIEDPVGIERRLHRGQHVERAAEGVGRKRPRLMPMPWWWLSARRPPGWPG